MQLPITTASAVQSVSGDMPMRHMRLYQPHFTSGDKVHRFNRASGSGPQPPYQPPVWSNPRLKALPLRPHGMVRRPRVLKRSCVSTTRSTKACSILQVCSQFFRHGGSRYEDKHFSRFPHKSVLCFDIPMDKSVYSQVGSQFSKNGGSRSSNVLLSRFPCGTVHL